MNSPVQLLGALLALVWAVAAGADPAAHYAAQCAACHDAPVDAKVPDTAAIRRMNAVRIRHAVSQGKMREFIGDMTRRDVLALVEHLAADQAALMPPSAYCEGNAPTPNVSASASIDRWGLNARNSRWQRQTTISAANVGTLTLKWAFAAPGVTTMRSQPAVTADTVYLPTLGGTLYALDRESGCIRWAYQAERPLRTAATLGMAGDRRALFVGDQGSFVHAVDATSGDSIWLRHVGLFEASMLTGASIEHAGRLYVPISAFDVARAMDPNYECCTSHGGVRALDAATGDILWTARMTPEAKPTYKNSLGVQMWGPSGAPIWTTPAIDEKRGVLYVGTGENTSSPATDLSDAIVAIGMGDGKIRWHFQGTKNDAFNMACGRRRSGPNCPKENGPDFDFGASVIIAQDSEGKDVLLAGQKSGAVFALDPDADGALRWQRRLSPGSALGGVHWGIAADAEHVYVPIADPPGLPERKPGVWALNIDDGTDAWHYAADRGCVPAGRRGDSPWPDCSFRYAFSAAASIAGDVVLAGALDGRAFAFDAEDGRVLWEQETSQEFAAANGIEAHGGAIDSPGIVAVDDLVIVPSGYGMFGQMPGNALLVFALPKPSQ